MKQNFPGPNKTAVEYFSQDLTFETGPFQVYEAAEPLQIIDLRSRADYEIGHVPKAVNIDLDDLSAHLEQLDRSVIVVVYCYNVGCTLAARAAIILAEDGFTVKRLFGGWEEYLHRKLPVEKLAG